MKKKEYSEKNKDKLREYNKKYVEENREKILRIKTKYNRSEKGIEKGKEYRRKSEVKERRREYIKIWQRERLKKNLNFAIKRRLQRRLLRAIEIYIKEKRYLRSKKFKLDYEKIINHLIPFPKDISKYHIDHIKPLCSFDLTNDKEAKKAFSPENHQWLLIKENLSKGGKYEK